MNYFITRHSGALKWLEQQIAEPAIHLDHLDLVHVYELNRGDRVIGNLPVNLIFELCRRGVRYFHLQMVVPETLRGQELTSGQMTALGADLVEYLFLPPPSG
ncbi:MAG: CRISPR-associated protein Csx16 [Nitrincola sp.]|nr:CRISPR-associated protein Csx16 [Nitrincola sp.]